MTTELSPTKPTKTKAPARASSVPPETARLADLGLLAAFLALVFVLGIFPNKDTDLWWHLKTGQIIRSTGTVPTTDIYSFIAADRPWTDLHWGFQVLASLVYERGGVPLLNLVKCTVTTLALLLLITAKRKDWPLWAMILAWLPALFVLSGRMYIRPETMTLLYLSAELAVLFRWADRPKIAYLLPIIQLAWVNCHSLFILGPVMISLAMFDQALRGGSFSPEGLRWWKTVGPAVGLTGLVCLINPYGLSGALFPLEVAKTMSNPVFNSIAELQSIPSLIESTGLSLPPLQIHLVTMALGALSFLLPMFWLAATRIRSGPINPEPKKKKAKGKPAKAEPSLWRLSPLRLFMYAIFSLLSLKASRNSHQFAAVVGTMTAWNIGEWLSAIRRRKQQLDSTYVPNDTVPRIASYLIVFTFLGLVLSGVWYSWMREGRTMGLGEEPLWFPHEAVKFAGRPGMPDRVIGFHNGHTPLYAFYHGPEKKIYVDARLEVMGPKIHAEYEELQRRVMRNERGWDAEFDRLGRPVILVDNINQGPTDVSATLLASLRWKCVYFDPIAAVFLHEGSLEKAGVKPVDFAKRHFDPDPADQPRGVPELLTSSKALRFIATALVTQGRTDIARPLILLGLDQARRASEIVPSSAEALKAIALFEWIRQPALFSDNPTPRYKSEFRSSLDLESAIATYRLNRALQADPTEFSLLFRSLQSYQARGMIEAALPLMDRLLDTSHGNITQAGVQTKVANDRAKTVSDLGAPAPTKWENSGELDKMINDLLQRGRVESAAILIEKAYRPESRPWIVSDRLATLWLHLGEPDKAQECWTSALEPPSEAVRLARLGLCRLVLGDFVKARRAYRDALALDNRLFEASYGLAYLELDAGNALDAVDAAKQAINSAPNEPARNAAQSLMALASPYAHTKP